jgi:hypothetical protein
MTVGEPSAEISTAGPLNLSALNVEMKMRILRSSEAMLESS